jgi:hypothetical protein
VKRLSVTALIALYTVMLMWSSADRTYTWASIQSQALAHSSDDSSISVCTPRTLKGPHQINRRILEDQFAMEPPVVAAWIVLSPEVLQQSQNLLTAGTDVWQASGRAPPRSL